MADFVDLAVHRLGRADHVAAKGLTDHLVAQAHAEHRQLAFGGAADQIKTNAGIIGNARPRRNHDGFRRHGERFIDADDVVSPDLNLDPQFAKIVNQVVGEAIVVID